MCGAMAPSRVLTHHMVPLSVALLIVFIHCCSFVCSFNLEPRIPVVKIGSPKSHFGYSVAQHKEVNEGFASKKRYVPWILVGAPKDHNLQPGTNRSGALWKCPLTTNTDDCTQVHTDGFKDDQGVPQPPSEDEIKDDQWLGVTVKSQGTGGDVLVCAHRYMHKGRGYQWGFGLCYLLDQKLHVINSMEPCRGKPVRSGHQQYGFCQAGISGMVLEDEVVLGVPGPYTWRGTVHTSNISKNFLFRDKTQYFGPVTENESPVDKYSYLGYSVTAGKFLGDFVSYVGGAPRSNGTGQVVFFSRNKIGESLLLFDLILDGEMFASSFGFEVLGVDINNDGRDDLVVSAPFYYTRHSSGAIYIYMNTDVLSRDTKYTKIEGPPGESRFGFSMTSLGDLNLDGYKDIAVGAPYEDKGAIYIYLGSADGLVVEPAQVIRPSDLPGPSYDAFGYALSGGMDMDGNGYPDLLTSSFCSDRVVLIRARPVISIETLVLPEGGPKHIDPSKSGCPDDEDAEETCFSFDACFKMGTLEESTRTGLLLQYTIEERMYQDQPIPRVHFNQDAERSPKKLQRKLTLKPQDIGQYRCEREVGYLRTGSRDLLRPLRFKLSYEIIQREPQPVRDGDPLPNVDDFPILDQQEAVKFFQGDFVKDCGTDDICDSDLRTTAELLLPWDSVGHHQIFELGKRNMAVLKSSVTNVGEPAYEPNLYIRHHKSMVFNPPDSDTGSYICNSAKSDLVHCTLDNPLTDSTGPMSFSFKPSGYFDKSFIHFIVFANSTSNELTPEKPIELALEIVKRAEISISGSVDPEQVFFSGDVVGESGVEDIENIGAEITHKYVVDNKGPWRVDYLDVEILWPHQVENYQPQGKWLLYLTQVPVVDGDGECEVHPDYVNAVGLKSSKEPEYGYFGGVQGEVEVTGSGKSTTVRPSEEDEEAFEGHGSSSSSSTIVTRRNSTVTKKITSSSTINAVRSESSKSSKESDRRIQHSSSSSGSRSHSDSRHHTNADDDYNDENYDYYNYLDENYDDPSTDNQPASGSGRSVSRTSSRTSSSSANRIDTDPTNDNNEGSRSYSSSRTHSTRTHSGGDNRNQYDRDSNRFDSGPETAGSRVSSSSSSIRRTETSRTSTSGDADDGRERQVDNSSQSGFSDRRLENSEFDSGWESRRYDGGRGREDRRKTGRTYVGEDGSRNTENTHEIRTSYVDGSNNLAPGLDDRDLSRNYSRREYSRKVYSSNTLSGRNELDESNSIDAARGSSGRPQHRSGYDSGSRNSYDSRYGSSSNRFDDRHYRARDREEDRHYDRNRDSSFSTSRSHSGQRGASDVDDERRYSSQFDRDESQPQSSRSHSYSSRSYSRSSSANHDGEGLSHTSDSHPSSSSSSSSRSYSSRSYGPSSTDSDGESGSGSGSGGVSYNRDESRRYHSSRRSQDNEIENSGREGERYSSRSRNGQTYSKTVVDDRTGDARVYSKHVFDDDYPTDPHPIDDPNVHRSTSGGQYSGSRRNGELHTSLHRIKRAQEMVVQPEAYTDDKTGKVLQVVNLRCTGDVPTAKCIPIRCSLRNLGAESSATIRVFSRLWNATLVEDYSHVNLVNIQSRGEIILPEELRSRQDESDDVATAETKAYANLLEQSKSVPLWVILLSIFAGLLILVIIILVMWKCGFFKRKRPGGGKY